MEYTERGCEAVAAEEGGEREDVTPRSEPTLARLTDLGRDQCKWPVAVEDGEHRFCAMPVAGDPMAGRASRVYCADHAGARLLEAVHGPRALGE